MFPSYRSGYHYSSPSFAYDCSIMPMFSYVPYATRRCVNFLSLISLPFEEGALSVLGYYLCWIRLVDASSADLWVHDPDDPDGYDFRHIVVSL